MEFFAHLHFIAMALHHFIQQFAGNVDILAERFGRVAAEEQAVKKRRFPLRS
jgi:hypothetical protein